MRDFRSVCAAIVAVATIAVVSTPVHAQTVRSITDLRPETFAVAGIADDGSVIWGRATFEFGGANPDRAYQMVRWTLPGGAIEQLTSLPDGVRDLAVSDDGSVAVLLSTDDPLGTNPDHSLELFVADGSGAIQTQLTSLAIGPRRAVLTPAVSGDGSLVVFASDQDLVGANADGSDELFRIAADGTGLTQITALAAGATIVDHPVISDNGSRIIFRSTADPFGTNPGGGSALFAIASDGTLLHQLSPSTVTAVYGIDLSGSGVLAAYQADGTLYTVPWTGGSPVTVTIGSTPSLTDNGSLMYFSADPGDGSPEIFSIRSTGGVRTQLTSTAGANQDPVVSGDNSRVIFQTNDAFTGGTNPDGSRELAELALSVGAVPHQLTESDRVDVVWQPDIAEDGGSVVHLLGQDVARSPATGGAMEMLTAGAGANGPSINADASAAVFVSWYDLVPGENPNGESQIFRIDDDGLAQLTPDGSFLNDHPAVAEDAGLVVFQSVHDYTGGNPNSSAELYVVPLAGGAFTQLTDDDDGLRKDPRVDAAGQWVVYHSGGDPLGTNADGSTEVFRVRTDGSDLEQLSFGTTFANRPDVSDDGARIVWASSDDPLGTNADGNTEIFLYEPATATLTQLTDSSAGDSVDPTISGDGTVVGFLSTAPIFEAEPLAAYEPFRITIATGVIERAGGLRDPAGVMDRASLRNPLSESLDHDGQRLAFAASLDCDDSNLDHGWEIWLADFGAVGRFAIDRSAPATVAWTAEPQPVTYDLVRGDVADLSIVGNTVELGPVDCLDDDSTDTRAVDPLQPAPGQAFFYVHRGSQGPLDGPGSWGTDPSGRERVSTACD